MNRFTVRQIGDFWGATFEVRELYSPYRLLGKFNSLAEASKAVDKYDKVMLDAWEEYLKQRDVF